MSARHKCTTQNHQRSERSKKEPVLQAIFWAEIKLKSFKEDCNMQQNYDTLIPGCLLQPQQPLCWLILLAVQAYKKGTVYSSCYPQLPTQPGTEE